MDAAHTYSVLYVCIIDYYAGGLVGRADAAEGITKWLNGEELEVEGDETPETTQQRATTQSRMSPADRAMSDNMEAFNKLEEWAARMEAQ